MSDDRSQIGESDRGSLGANHEARYLTEQYATSSDRSGGWNNVLALVAVAIMAFVVIGILLMTGVFNPNDPIRPLNTELKQESSQGRT
jgi:hypothetical protein